MKKLVRTLRNREDLLMNYFKAGKLYNSGIECWVGNRCFTT